MIICKYANTGWEGGRKARSLELEWLKYREYFNSHALHKWSNARDTSLHAKNSNHVFDKTF